MKKEVKTNVSNFGYVKCSRCELNYIRSHDEYCYVCKAQMRVPGYTLIKEEKRYPKYRQYWRKRPNRYVYFYGGAV